jgi:transcriptional regulator with XRE-family HTH domain
MATRFSRPVIGKYFSEGARLLWVFMLRENLSQKDLATRVNAPTEDGQVNSWLYGRRRPGLGPALEIEATIGIPARAWLEAPAERFKVPGIAEAPRRARRPKSAA